MNCWECGTELKVIHGKPYHYTECGLPNVHLYGIVQYECPTCNTTSVSLPSINDLHRTIGKAVVHKKDRLTGAEVKFLRKELNLKSKKLAEILGVKPETFSRWENEKTPISETCDKFLRNLYISYVSEQTGEFMEGGILGLLATVSKTVPEGPSLFELSAQDWLSKHRDTCEARH